MISKMSSTSSPGDSAVKVEPRAAKVELAAANNPVGSVFVAFQVACGENTISGQAIRGILTDALQATDDNSIKHTAQSIRDGVKTLKSHVSTLLLLILPR